MRLCYYCM